MVKFDKPKLICLLSAVPLSFRTASLSLKGPSESFYYPFWILLYHENLFSNGLFIINTTARFYSIYAAIPNLFHSCIIPLAALILILFFLRSFRLMINRCTFCCPAEHGLFHFVPGNSLHYLQYFVCNFSCFFHFTFTSCFIIFAKHIKDEHNMIAIDI